jgi:hypothetical protein
MQASLGPYRTLPPRTTSARVGSSAERAAIEAADAVPWLLVAIGGGRVVQALLTGEVWGAEATVFACFAVFGVLELLFKVRALVSWRSSPRRRSRDPVTTRAR